MVLIVSFREEELARIERHKNIRRLESQERRLEEKEKEKSEKKAKRIQRHSLQLEVSGILSLL